MTLYQLTGSGLALELKGTRAHARSGDPAMISGYLGNSSVFDEAVTKFAKSYADQTERDHKTLARAVAEGRLEAVTD